MARRIFSRHKDDHAVHEDRETRFGEYAGTARPVMYEKSAGNRVANIFYTITGILASLLALRFVLLLAGANPNNGFVEFIYGLTSPLVAPFQSIFGRATPEAGAVAQSVFEPASLIAIAIVSLVGWFIAKMFDSAARA